MQYLLRMVTILIDFGFSDLSSEKIHILHATQVKGVTFAIFPESLIIHTLD